jgi:Lon protease-like protein
MFPLGSVVFPHMLLPLHIFEPRYQVLMFDCTRGDPEFGAVLIERGIEVGGDDERFTVGTLVSIVEARELADGRWLLTAVGVRRIRVDEWLPDDPYPLARVEDLPDASWAPADDAERQRAEPLVRKALALTAELGEPVAPSTVALAGEPEVAAWQLAAIAPLGHLDRQRLLETEGHGTRMAMLAALMEDEISVLAYRLGGR